MSLQLPVGHHKSDRLWAAAHLKPRARPALPGEAMSVRSGKPVHPAIIFCTLYGMHYYVLKATKEFYDFREHYLAHPEVK